MNNEETHNPKCSNCKCYWKPDETDFKSSGLYFKTCKKCRDKNKVNILCECGATIRKNGLKAHLVTHNHRIDLLKKEHLQFIDGKYIWTFDK